MPNAIRILYKKPLVGKTSVDEDTARKVEERARKNTADETVEIVEASFHETPDGPSVVVHYEGDLSQDAINGIKLAGATSTMSRVQDYFIVG